VSSSPGASFPGFPVLPANFTLLTDDGVVVCDTCVREAGQRERERVRERERERAARD
jgi:hypothetical protein